MISSMTGFGTAAGEAEGISYTIEIKTVNNRYFKAHLRLPEIASFLEGDIEKLLRDRIRRGTVSCALHVKNVSGQALFEIDESTLAGYIARLRDIAEANKIQSPIDIAALLNLPGVVQPFSPDETQTNSMKETVLDLVNQAIEQVKGMRQTEGAALGRDMVENCRVIKEKLQSARERSGIVVQEYHDKLKKRVDELLAGAKLNIDEELLARETAIFADRCDIAEELTRLNSHLDMFTEHCQQNRDAGRRLDFISQEMLREANTIASKAADSQIARWVIDMKCAIDRIKEQVQNVE
ncbi:MAG: YicC family protein [Planctomycetota bacterium]|nr:MAG: YicC family protein [Planctomycetota bacterium]